MPTPTPTPTITPPPQIPPSQKLTPLAASTSAPVTLSPKASRKTPALLTEFRLFSKLPLEVRLKIFTLSLPDPRLIPLVYIPPAISVIEQPQLYHHHHHHYQDRQYDQYQQTKSQGLPSPIPNITHSHIITPNLNSTKSKIIPPSLLHTSQESRKHIQNLYTPCLPLRGIPFSSKQTLYRPSHDILYFPSLPLRQQQTQTHPGTQIQTQDPSPYPSPTSSTSLSPSRSASSSFSSLRSNSTSSSSSLSALTSGSTPASTTVTTLSTPYQYHHHHIPKTPNTVPIPVPVPVSKPRQHSPAPIQIPALIPSTSFTNFTSIHTLATPLSLMFIRRLAVSEDVFLEVEKARWRRFGPETTPISTAAASSRNSAPNPISISDSKSHPRSGSTLTPPPTPVSSSPPSNPSNPFSNQFTFTFSIIKPTSTTSSPPPRTSRSRPGISPRKAKGTSKSQAGSGRAAAAGRGASSSGSQKGIDAITVENLNQFWDAIRRKFWGLEEVWILGERGDATTADDVDMGRKILSAEIDDDDEDDRDDWGARNQTQSQSYGSDERRRKRRRVDDDTLQDGNGNGNGHVNGNGNVLTKERRMSFKAKIERSVRKLEEETGWVAPKWRYLECEDEEDDVSTSNFYVAEPEVMIGGGDDFVHKSQYISAHSPVKQKHDCWAWLEAKKACR